ncbi:hypothetical protein [Aureimonas populi]|uniref:Uncharacterized protein n=1 Tax=Aureimonas populi TaxID=1701758 RepID=A0ABW5CLD0_9HYPH|nr:hypothetical protein [Aureimonas populi]
MNDLTSPAEIAVRFAAEGAMLFGDDPAKIRRHMEAALSRLPEEERRKVHQCFCMMALEPSSPKG